MRITTHGQVAFAWFTDKAERNEYSDGDRIPGREFLPGFIWEGDFSHIPDKIARRVAPLHPNFMKYYVDALAVLWKFKFNGKEASTENAKWAIQGSNKPPKEKYVVIWEPVNHEEGT